MTRKTDDLSALVTEYKQLVDDTVANVTDAIVPTLIVITKEGVTLGVALLADMNDVETRYGAVRAAGSELRDKGMEPMFCGMISEVWMSSKGFKDWPSKNPNRCEGINVVFQAADGQSMSATLTVSRDQKNNLVPINWKPCGACNSPLLEEFFFGWDAAHVARGGRFAA